MHPEDPAGTARPDGIPGSSLTGPWPVGQYADRLRDRLRALARVQVFGEVFNLRAGRARVWFELRDARGALPCSMWREDFDAARGAARRRHARRGRGRLRLLPGLARGVAGVLVRRLRRAGRRRGRPARAARPAAPRARRGGAVRAAEAARRAPRCRAASGSSRARAARRATTCWPGCAGAAGPGRVVWAFAPVQDRRAAPAVTRALQDLAACEEVDVDHRRARRRLARRPVRLLRRDAVPDRRDAARAGDRLRRPPHRPDADRRRRRGLVLDADPRGRGRRPGRLRRRPRAAPRPRGAARAAGPARDRRARAHARPALARAGLARRTPPHPAASARCASCGPAPAAASPREHRTVAGGAAVLERRSAAAQLGLARGATRAHADAAALDHGRAVALARRAETLERLRLALDAHDPQRTLERGYALVEDEHGTPLASAPRPARARRLALRLADGSLPVRPDRRRARSVGRGVLACPASAMTRDHPDLRDRLRADRGDHPPARLRRGRPARDARAVPGGPQAGRVLRGRARGGRAWPRGAQARRAGRPARSRPRLTPDDSNAAATAFRAGGRR